MAKNPRLIDMTGKRFGQLVVIEQAGNSSAGAAIWRCQCDCGKETKTNGGDLRFGKSTSCGHDNMKKFRASTIKHGQTGTRLYRTWKNMRSRCNNPNASRFEIYGGRGISVCKEWDKFEVFYEWALDNGYNDSLTIERKNVDGNYEPENCCWITSKMQAMNKRNVPTNDDGVPWNHVAKMNNISTAAYRTRVHDGWPLEQAATWPMYKKRPDKLR